jgi:uncharacterized protein YoxC
MADGPDKLAREFYRLLILLVVLQGAAIALVLGLVWDRNDRDRTLIERTGVMIDTIFPGLQTDLSELSKKAVNLKADVSELRNQVTRVDEHVGQVDRDVSQVSRQAHDINTSLTGFVEDKSGLIWGHSLTPYLLLGLATLVAASVPIWGWFFSIKRRSQQPSRSEVHADSTMESFVARLDRLALLVERIREVERESLKPSPELQQLMLEAERLIREARNELGQLSTNIKPVARDGETKFGALH